MKKFRVISAISALALLCACGSAEFVGRSDTAGFLYDAPSEPYEMSAMMDLRAPDETLAAVSMKQVAGEPQGLAFSDRARKILASYGK